MQLMGKIYGIHIFILFAEKLVVITYPYIHKAKCTEDKGL